MKYNIHVREYTYSWVLVFHKYDLLTAIPTTSSSWTSWLKKWIYKCPPDSMLKILCKGMDITRFGERKVNQSLELVRTEIIKYENVLYDCVLYPFNCFPPELCPAADSIIWTKKLKKALGLTRFVSPCHRLSPLSHPQYVCISFRSNSFTMHPQPQWPQPGASDITPTAGRTWKPQTDPEYPLQLAP